MDVKSIKILAIGDNQDDLAMLKALLSEEFPEATFLSALHGLKGFEIAAKEEPEIILIDIIVPDGDGYEVCRKLKEDIRLCNIPVLFVMAMNSSKESRIKAIECGVEFILTKPFDQRELSARIRTMLKNGTAYIEKMNECETLAGLVQEKTRELAKSKEEALNLLKELRLANLEIKKSEEYLLDTQKLALSGSFEYDMKSNVMTYTDGMLHICGVKRKEFTGEQDEIIQYVHPDDRKEIIEMNELAISENREVEINYRMIRADGEERNMVMRVRPVTDNNGNCIKTTGVVQDITQSKKIEEHLKQNLKDLLESQRISHTGTWRLNLETNQVVWSEELYHTMVLIRRFRSPPTRSI